MVEVDRAELIAEFGESGEKTPEVARITPAFVEGAFRGFRLTKIKSDGLVARMGFVDGDVILGLDDTVFTSPEAALAAYDAVKEKSEIRVRFLRGDAERVVSIEIRNE